MSSIKASVYNETNIDNQLVIGKQLINKIVNENNILQYDIALDIGCGTGNVTRHLADTLPVKQIYAIDINKEWIQFADEVNAKPNINYLVQDFSADWDVWPAELRTLAGRVDLIFSNAVMDWMPDRHTAAKHLATLLRTGGGKAYLHFIAKSNLRQYEDTDDNLDQWRHAFTTAGLTIICGQTVAKTNVMTFSDFEQNVLTLAADKMDKKLNDQGDKCQTMDQLRRKAMDNYCTFVDQTTGQTLIRNNNIYLEFVLKK